MVNIFFELERLRISLLNKGYDESTVSTIVDKAEKEIASRLKDRMDDALETAVQSGVQKDSPEFINSLRPSLDAFILETDSGVTDFSEPPMPMLERLLSSAKPIKDGSGVYKVIPVGASNDNYKKPVHTSIMDAQKAIMAKRYEDAVAQYSKIAPQKSAVRFRTATSKQDKNTQWVLPAKEKDFTEDLNIINSMLKDDRDAIIMDVIRSYEEGF